MRVRRLFGHAVQVVGGIALAALACVTLPAISQHSHSVVLDPGTVLVGQLSNNLSSNNSQKGDTFVVVVHESDTHGATGSDALPVGSKIEGVVREVHPKQDKNPGMIDLKFTRVILPDGAAHKIHGSLIGLDNKSVTKTGGGRLVANPGHRTDRQTYVGIGAGAGAIVGLATGHHQPLKDTAIGAGLGYLYGALRKHDSGARDVNLKSGTRIGIRLDNSLTYAYR